LKFIADSMLGRLANWMRIIGCDVTYYRMIGDSELVDLAQREGRIILTRDTLLIKRRKAKGNSFLVEGNNYKDQLRQVIRHFSINPSRDFLTRCAECNLVLSNIEKETVKDTIPEYVYMTQETFSECPGCHRIYWSATHKEAILKLLEEVLED